MTVQERPLALSGDAATAWPVALEPLPIAQAGGDPAETGDSGCYPDWEFLQAGWTAAGRTFQAVVGFAPDATEEEREAVAAAFASMTFEPAAEPAKSAVIATGTAGGETWELTAERQGGALSLSLNAESGGSGGGSEPGSSELFLLSHLLGEGEEAQLVVFGAVPVGSTQVKARDGDAEVVYRVLDVPDTIDAELDAFVFTTSPEAELQVIALDKSGEVLAMGEVGPARDPAEAPVPTVVDVEPEHGGVVWGLYLALGDSLDDPAMDAARQRATELGYHPGGGELACDDGAAEALGVDASYSVAVYFRTREDAEAAAALFGSAPVGIARVTTYCLD
jgi:hypothetical protein